LPLKLSGTEVEKAEQNCRVLIHAIISDLLANTENPVEGESGTASLDLGEAGAGDTDAAGKLLLRDSKISPDGGQTSAEEGGGVDNGHRFP
jgi:hypothetical protein